MKTTFTNLLVLIVVLLVPMGVIVFSSKGEHVLVGLGSV